jgi:selenoprotein W-related protein
VGLANELLMNFEPEIESVSLVPSNGGRFEVSVNGQLVYSKLQTGRHAEPGEIIGLVQKLSRKKMG